MSLTKGAVLRSLFGIRVEGLLEKAGLSVPELAERTGLPAGRVKAILRGGYARLTLSDMSRIASALDVTVFALLAPDELPLPVVAVEKVEKR